MGENEKLAFQLSFNRFLRVGFQGSKLTSNGGLILVRELDERLGFSELIDEHLTDSRANNARFSFADLLRQSVYSRLAGYEDVNDAERLSHDPTFRLIGSEKIWDRGAALTSRLQTFETEMLVETGREGFGKAGSEPMDLSEKKSCSVGSEWVYIVNCRKAKKEISADHNLPVDLFPRRQPLIEAG